jgi:hypothetical protein
MTRRQLPFEEPSVWQTTPSKGSSMVLVHSFLPARVQRVALPSGVGGSMICRQFSKSRLDLHSIQHFLFTHIFTSIFVSIVEPITLSKLRTKDCTNSLVPERAWLKSERVLGR